MDSAHNNPYIRDLDIVSERGAKLTEDDLQTTSSAISSLLSTSIDYFMRESMVVLEGPSCTGLKNYKTLYRPNGQEDFENEGTGHLLGKAVYYFLRVPVVIDGGGYSSLSPIKPPRAEIRRTPREYNYFKGEESAEYLAFLHRWSADLTKCEGFFEYLKSALAQPIPADLLEIINMDRDFARRICAGSSLRIGALGPWTQRLAENTTVREFLTHLVQLAYYVNKGNMWRKERGARLWKEESPYYFYNGEFAGECIQIFRSFLMTIMSPLRLEWLAVLARAAGAAATPFKSSRTGPGAGAGAGAGAGVPWPPRLAPEDVSVSASAVKSSPTWPGAGGPRPPPRLALEDAPASSSSASASARYDLRKRGRGRGEGEEHGGRRNRSRHSSSKGRRRARSSSKCSIM